MEKALKPFSAPSPRLHAPRPHSSPHTLSPHLESFGPRCKPCHPVPTLSLPHPRVPAPHTLSPHLESFSPRCKPCHPVPTLSLPHPHVPAPHTSSTHLGSFSPRCKPTGPIGGRLKLPLGISASSANTPCKEGGGGVTDGRGGGVEGNAFTRYALAIDGKGGEE